MGSAHSTRNVSRGTPQAAVLSNLLWVLVVNQLLSLLEEAGTKVVAYADDVVILRQGTKLCISEALLTTATEALNTTRPPTPGPTCQNLATATALRLREAAAWTTGSTGHSSILTKHTSLPYSTGYVPPIVIPTGTD